ncbi:MAG: FAD binding domain-containing protein [Actinomycetota bacterium]
MFPSRFEYAAPRSLDEAVATLAQRGDEAKVLSGGQSLIPLLKLRFAAPSALIDINRVPGLGGIEESNGHLSVGALARHNELASNRVLAERYPAMAAAAPLIADPIVRNLGTIGGSLAHADPAGDWGSVMLALDAEVVVRGPSGERAIGIDDFLVDIFTTSLASDEIVTGVRVAKPQGAFGGAYLKLERKVGDFATVGAAVHLELSDGAISRAGIGLTAVGPRNVKAAEAEQALQGAQPSDELFAEAGRLSSAATEPISDVRGSADYKRAVVETFVKRGLARALEGARSQ